MPQPGEPSYTNDDPLWFKDAIVYELNVRAYHDSGGFTPSEMTTDTRLIGRSVWNTKWLLIIPGDLLLDPPEMGIDRFIGDPVDPGVSDILLYFQTYAYSGN